MKEASFFKFSFVEASVIVPAPHFNPYSPQRDRVLQSTERNITSQNNNEQREEKN
jgi:hypothetical protein